MRDWTVKLRLEDGESMLRSSIARAQVLGSFWPAEGRLYLTSKRLIWKRSIINLPRSGPGSFEIALNTVQDCWLQGIGFGLRTKDGGYWFAAPGLDHIYLFWGRTAKKWRQSIFAAIGRSER